MDSPEELERLAPRPGFFARLGIWLRPWKHGDDARGDRPAAPAEASSAGSDLAWPRRRTSQLSRLEEGFEKLVGLVDTLDRHVQSQAERSEQTLAQARRIADAVGQAQGLARQRTEAVEQLTDQFRNQTRQMQQVAEAVEALPRTIKQQSEQLGQIRDQLEAQLEAQLSTAQGVRQLAGATEVLRTLADEQRRNFEKVFENVQATSLQIAQVMDRQGRRWTWLMAFALGLGLAAAAAAAAAIYLVHARLA